MIKAIVALDDALGIGREGMVPWRGQLPDDMRWFRQNTLGGAILMGRKTFDDIGHTLPDRRNFVASRQQPLSSPDITYIPDAPTFVGEYHGDLWVIGGAEIFVQTLDLMEELYITRVSGEYGCTVFFPSFASDFRRISRSPVRTENGINYHFEIWKRAR